MSWACRQDGETRNTCGILVVKDLERQPLARSRNRWEDNIKENVMEGNGRNWLSLEFIILI
jgi:hypothetical protein